MDGTGLLFDEFISSYYGECLVPPLPTDVRQDYLSLARMIEKKLPHDDFILLAESFSGCLAPYLLKNSANRILGVIFVASFLSSPSPRLLSLAKILLITKLTRFPFASFILKGLFLGRNAPDELVVKFVNVISSLSGKLLRQRLTTIKEMHLIESPILTPAIYLQGTNDKLVAESKWEEFSKIFINIMCYRINDPHFILQSKPVESAKLVSEWISFLKVNHSDSL
jgi:alpha-beta hydrolase superfamily lysophospholipase